ncbi:hypothetical protein GWK08_18480 [Leptobacterium flavescens]|uniref:Uncharacterized protein n=1 Tax=Leptobacterium flavescens TaxID=472055 RepID=A0A6P0URA9_9FLAO|nr:hypothetical protein [Leptobacterium flavescens]NER15447.1 hypothetical protein [Leptobacterium flavescens]
MFSTGQWAFAIFFVIAFIAVMLFSYRKDKNLHLKYYKGTKWILLGFILFVIILFIIKFLIKD